MSKIHHLLTTNGLQEARALAVDKIDRQCIDTAFAVMTDESNRLGLIHAGFAMTALPHRDLTENVWIRQGGNVTLRVESGTSIDGKPVGLPFGSVARLILLYLQTEAVKTRSRDVELGRSMRQWLTTMGIDGGGKNYRLVREQAKRLSLCRLTFYRETQTSTHVTNGGFVRDAIIPSNESDQLPLWREIIRLDEGFYASLIEHPMPVQEAAIRQLSGGSLSIDIYCWLAYRLHSLEKPLSVSWGALFQQFGGGYKEVRQFRRRFYDPLNLALAAYPNAKTSVDDSGMILYPSPPPVAYKGLARVK